MSVVLARMNERQKQDMVAAALALAEALEGADKKEVSRLENLICARTRLLKKEFGLEDAPAGS